MKLAKEVRRESTSDAWVSVHNDGRRKLSNGKRSHSFKVCDTTADELIRLIKETIRKH